MGKLQDKVALVTGASKGIGAAIAQALADEGAAVVVNYASDRAGAERVVAAIGKGGGKGGGKAIAVQADVSKSADVERLFAEAKNAFGRLDVLVNNAGIYAFGTIEEFSEAEYRRQFDTNVLGLLLASQQAAKAFGPDGGSIVNIGSGITEMTPPATAIYTATKGAVVSITRVLAKELGPRKIRVNTISPGGVDTEGVRAMGVAESDFGKELVARTPLGRQGKPEDIAPLAVFLASADGAWLTGEVILASGGLR